MPSFLPLLVDPEEVADAVEGARRDIRYVVTDFSVELIASKFKTQDSEIYIPEYQRALSWTAEQMSFFIESLILRVPVPPVFFHEVEGRLEIVDGSQRIRSIVDFIDNKIELRGLDKLDVLNGFHFEDLPLAIQRRFNNTPIRSFVLEEGTDETTRIDLFRRLNTTGKKLQDAEVRKGAYRGPFLDLVIESANSDLMRQLTRRMRKGIDEISERQELVTRFYIYLQKYIEFRHDVRKFLDKATVEFNESMSDESLIEIRGEFDGALSFISQYLPGAFYRQGALGVVPRVRFEAVSVGVALALRETPSLTLEDATWLTSTEFEELTRTDASNSGPKLRNRIEFVRDRLLGVS